MPKPKTWLALVAGAAVLGAAGYGVWSAACPRGLVHISGESGGRDIGGTACLDHGGFTTPERYLVLSNGGRVSFFGGPAADLEGQTVIFRGSGDRASWYCGTAAGGHYDFEEGEAKIRNVGLMLDEATAARGKTLTVSNLGGAILGDCSEPTVTVDGLDISAPFTIAATEGGRERDELGFTLVTPAVSLVLRLELASPLPAEGPATLTIDRAWIRLVDEAGGALRHRMATSGAGSTLVRDKGCVKIALADVTEPAACPADANGGATITW